MGNVVPSRDPNTPDTPEPEPLSLLIKALGCGPTILAAHTPDESGMCRSCSGQVQTVRWPCSLRFYALEAKALEDGDQ